MIDTKKYKEIEVFEPTDSITLFAEEDFIEFAEKPENKGYLFFVKEYHPEDEEKVIAHDCYIFDVISRHWFTYQDILVSQEAYDKLHEEIEESDEQSPAQSHGKVPNEFKQASPEELATKMVELARREFPDEDNIRIYDVSQLFWSQMNVERFNLSPEMQLKMQKVEMQARKQIEIEQEAKLKTRLEKEKTELPSLVVSCAEWAKEKGLKRLTLPDVEAFAIEKELQVHSQTKRSLYALANTKLKSQ